MASQPSKDNTSPIGRFIICAETSNEFLAQDKDLGDYFHLGWSMHAESAIHYESADEAAAIAKRISLAKERHLTVYEIPSRNGKVWLRPVISFGGPLPEAPPEGSQVH